MLSYFFIPAHKIDKISFIKSLEIDEIIIDFEDSVLEAERKELFLDLIKLNNYKDFYYRIPVRNSFKDEISLEFLDKVFAMGIHKVILPKLKSKSELKAICKKYKHLKKIKFILLVEHPLLLIELTQIFQSKKMTSRIHGIGLGSHDLMNYVGAEHKEEQLFYPRIKLLYLGKSYGKEVIDIASMNIYDKGVFEDEVKFGLEHGFDAKFMIHPQQIKWAHDYNSVRLKQIEWANSVVSSLSKEQLSKEVEPFILNGEVIEKPHVDKAFKILKKYKNGK